MSNFARKIRRKVVLNNRAEVTGKMEITVFRVKGKNGINVEISGVPASFHVAMDWLSKAKTVVAMGFMKDMKEGNLDDNLVRRPNRIEVASLEDLSAPNANNSTNVQYT